MLAFVLYVNDWAKTDPTTFARAFSMTCVYAPLRRSCGRPAALVVVISASVTSSCAAASRLSSL